MESAWLLTLGVQGMRRWIVAGLVALTLAGTSCNLEEWNRLSPLEQQAILDRVQASPVVKEALTQLGKPYRWGAAGPNSFDCSGLVMYSYGKLGKSVPHSARALKRMSQRVTDIRPGDLVFYGTHHVGIYIGGGQMVHAPHSGDVVKVSSLRKGAYYGRLA